MSFSDDYYKALEEQKKKKKKNAALVDLERERLKVSTQRYKDLNRYQSIVGSAGLGKKDDDDDIAPIKTVGTISDDKYLSDTQKVMHRQILAERAAEEEKAKKEKDEDRLFGVFQKVGAFEDGYDFGDVTKTILGTAGDLALNLVDGFVSPIEGVVKAAGYGAGVTIKNTPSPITKKILGMANVTPEEVGNALMRGTEGDIFGEGINGFGLNKADEFLDQYSVLGSRSDSITEGVGQLGFNLGLGYVAPWAVLPVMGVSSFGHGVGEAYEGGATDGEAAVYGTIAGVSDAVTEMLFSGLGKTVKTVGFSKGLSSADDMLAKKVSSKFSSTIAKNLSEYSIKAGAEGFEEVLAGVAQGIGKWITYASENKSREDLEQILADENLLDQFIVGAVTSGIAQSGVMPGTYKGSLAETTKNGKDFITGLTQNEQAVVDKELENRIAEREKSGEKVSSKEKNKIYEEVIRDFEKGYVKADTIESVLGGESYGAFKTEMSNFFNSADYKAYQKAVKDEESARAEFDPLVKMVTNEMTGEQIYRRDELKKILDESKVSELRAKLSPEATRIAQLRDSMRGDVFSRVKDSRLAESYRELARSQEKFTVDVSKYTNENAKQTVQSILDSGLGDNTNQFHETVDFLARMSADKGVVFDLTNNDGIKGTKHYKQGYVTNGFVTDDGKITLNMDSDNAIETIVGHEVTHTLEKAGAYAELQEALFEYAKTKEGKERLNARLEAAAEAYKGMNNTTPEAEVAADLVGEYLFTDYEFVNNLSKNDRNVFQKIYDEIKYLCKIAVAGSKEARQLEKAKKMFDQAYRENVKGKPEAEVETNTNTDTEADSEVEANEKYSIRKEAPPKETKKAYKLMRLVDGKLYPLFIGNNEAVEVGTWYNADSPNLSQLKDLEPGTHLVNMETGEAISWDEYAEKYVPKKNGKPARNKPNKSDVHWANDNGYRFMYIEDKAGGKSEGRMLKQYGDTRAYYNWGVNGSSKSKSGEGSASLYALRPGWHFGEVPSMHQIGYGGEAGDTVRLDNQVWVEVEMSADVDYNAEAEANWGGDIPTHIPTDGYYKFATNPTQKKTKSGSTEADATKADWYVAGAFKVNRIISDAEADSIVENYNKETGRNVPLDYRRNGGRVFNAETMSVEDVKYSVTKDSEGNDLTKEQQEFFKDSKIRNRNGNLLKVYHSTDAKFTVFDKAKIGSGNGGANYGEGFYFTPDLYLSSEYGGYVAEYYLNIKNPFEYYTTDKEYIVDMLEKSGYDYDKNAAESYDYDRLWDEDLIDSFISKVVKGKNPYTEFSKMVQSAGFDGIWEGEEIIAFEPNQIKRADNAKPTDNPDIRYSLTSDSEGKRLSKEQQEFFKDSKMRDENGSLKPMYHGTMYGGFHTFNKDYSDDSTSLFFVDDNEVAASYSGTSETYSARTFRTAEDFNNFFAEIGATEYEVREQDGKFHLYEDGDLAAISDTAEETYEEFREWSGLGYGDVNYKVYLNLKNPLEVDAEGRDWNALPSVNGDKTGYEYIKIVNVGDVGEVTIEYSMTGDTAPVTETVDLYEKFESGLADTLSNMAPGESVEGVYANPSTTRDYAKYAKENGYDGVIFKNIYDIGGYGNNGASEATVAIAFESNQVKSVANDKPTADLDIRFSLSKAVEETKDLVALHNLTETKLLKSLELGGLPMPSVAITKADIPHDNFGEITLILGKNSIDPKVNKKNVVYSADALTPTFPQVEYETDSNVERQLNRRLSDFASQVEDVFADDLSRLRYSHEDNLNRLGGEEGLIQYAMEKYGLRAAYLEEQGQHIERITKQVEVEKGYSSANEARYQAIADILGVSSADEIGKLNLKETIEQYGDQLEDIYPGMTKTAMRMSGIFRQVMAYMEDKSGEPVYRTVTDESAMRKAVDEKLDMEGFEAWTRKLFNGIVKNSGIYNNKDLFTPSGNRRSFKQTHLPFTLENIVKAMASQNKGNTKNVSGFNGIKSLRAGTAERFKSIEAMHERKGRLQYLTQEEADKLNDDLSTRLFGIIETIDNESGNHGESNPYIRFDIIGEILMEISEGGKYNVADIQKVFAEYRRNISDDLAADIKQLLFDVSQMPVNIYEAKPERAVGFDEVAVFVIPRNADVKLKQELLNRGYNIAEYDPDVEGDRQKVVNQFEEYKFSLSEVGKEPNNRGLKPANEYGKSDPLADFAPVREDVKPVAKESSVTPATVSKTENVAPVADLFPDDLSTIDEELDSLLQQKEALESRMQEVINAEDYDAFEAVNNEYNSLMARLESLEQEAARLDGDRLDSLDDADVPPLRETEYLNRADVVPLTKKAAQDIARDVRSQLALSNKHMYDVRMLIEEYSNSEFPDRNKLFDDIKRKFGTYTESYSDDTVKEAKNYLRTVGLSVSDSIKGEIADYAHLMRKNRGRILFRNDGIEVDSFYHELNNLFPNLFPENIYAPTDQFMQMVEVANMDTETEIEQELPDEAIWGVVDAITNSVTNYQQVQKEKAANKNAREAFNSLMKDSDSYVPTVDDDIAPVASTEPSVDEIIPTTENVIPKDKTAPSKADEPIQTANERLAKKLANYQNELAKNQQLREEAKADYDSEIARLQAEYEAKKNKRSLSAHDLLRRIEKTKRMKNNVDADYAKRINDLNNRVEKLNTKEAKTAAQRQTKMEQHTKMWENLLGDTSTWKDMSLGLSYKTKTLRRILRKVVRGADGKPDIALADRIYDELEVKYDHNEALLKRESQKVKAVFEKLNLNHAEDTYAHMLGELRHNPETELTPDVVKDYYNKHKGRIDTKKVDTAINEARKTFDALIVRLNAALKEQGFKEIPYRKGYFPHFTNPKQGWLGKLLNWKTIDTEIPTSIAGITETFTPQRSWQSFNKERKGDTTDYSLYQGLDTYIHGALDWIYHIDDLQSRRALENYIRYIHSEEGVKARIDEIKANEAYDADEAQDMIDAVLNEANNPLGGLVRELMNRTNTLANKKSSMDRGMEDATNRKIYSTMTNLNNRINANMVVGSFSSALTNFIPMVQSWHQVSPYFTVRGLGDYVRSVVRDDGMIEKSDFLTNRLIEEEKLYQTGWDKVSDKAAFMMNVIDSITSQTVWRSKYLQNIKEGMSESQAIKDADQFAKNLMAGRSRGNAPTIFDAKNPLVKIATAFQLEVANQYGFMFEDTPQDTKSKARLVKGYATAFLGAYAYNALYSSLVGRDVAFDPIGILEDLLRDMFGDDEEEPEDVVLNLVDNILEEVPYVGGLVGGGRIPISSALPYEGDYKSFISDAFNSEVKVKEMLKPLYYLLTPVGGGQFKKTVEGLSMFDDDLPVAGSYTDKGALRYPVADTVGNRIQAGLFGQWANENARDYIENGRKPLEEKQIQEFIDVDIPIRDYWEYREGLSGLKTAQEKADYINSLDLPIRKKNILINNQLDRKEKVDLTDYDEYSGLEEFDFANKYPEKYDFFQANGITYQDYANADEKGKNAYTWAYENPEKYTLSKAVTSDLFEYKRYTNDLYDIRADKDKNGKSISGSAKNKKIDYINSLDLDYGARLILFKDAYPADDTYNNEIIDYLNSRQDFTYEDRVTILKELGFTVLSDGTVQWD